MDFDCMDCRCTHRSWHYLQRNLLGSQVLQPLNCELLCYPYAWCVWCLIWEQCVVFPRLWGWCGTTLGWCVKVVAKMVVKNELLKRNLVHTMGTCISTTNNILHKVPSMVSRTVHFDSTLYITSQNPKQGLPMEKKMLCQRQYQKRNFNRSGGSFL